MAEIMSRAWWRRSPRDQIEVKARSIFHSDKIFLQKFPFMKMRSCREMWIGTAFNEEREVEQPPRVCYFVYSISADIHEILLRVEGDVKKQLCSVCFSAFHEVIDFLAFNLNIISVAQSTNDVLSSSKSYSMFLLAPDFAIEAINERAMIMYSKAQFPLCEKLFALWLSKITQKLFPA